MKYGVIMKKFLFVTLFTLVGCAHNPSYTKLDASEWTELTCSGFETWQNCRAEAQAICPHGFYTADHLENLLIQRRVVSVACKG
jgi:hypothetical protein